MICVYTAIDAAMHLKQGVRRGAMYCDSRYKKYVDAKRFMMSQSKIRDALYSEHIGKNPNEVTRKQKG
jgi:hypothetical protein